MSKQISKGIEVLVKKASVDPAFKMLLLEQRADAARKIGLELDTTESLMLAAVPNAQLEAIIARTSVPQEHRRAFLGQAAAAMLAALGSATPAWAGGSFGHTAGGASGGMFADSPDSEPPAEQDQPKPKAKRQGTTDERIIAILAEQFNVEKATIKRQTSLHDDLKADSSDKAKLKKELEREFDIKIPGTQFKRLDRIGQIINQVTRALPKDAVKPADKSQKQENTSPKLP
jgi:acyl carrier protein